VNIALRFLSEIEESLGGKTEIIEDGVRNERKKAFESGKTKKHFAGGD
jgi:hypothetical protein